MYKDKDKQREANRLATQRWRDRCVRGMVQGQGITNDRVSQITKKVSQEQGITGDSITVSQESMVIPDETPFTLPVDVRIRCANEKIIKPQSHNPMMVGYVPPKD